MATETKRIPELKNRINKDTGHFICNGKCGQEIASVGMIVKGEVYCLKCYRGIKKGG